MSEVFCNGLRMHYTEAGQGEPLILIMGLGASGEKWLRTWPPMKKNSIALP